MNVMYLIDIYSMIIAIGGAVGIGLIVGNGSRQQILQTTRDIAIPFGIHASLIGFVMMLANMDDPTAFGPALAVAFLSTLYGLLTYIVADSLLDRTAASVESPSSSPLGRLVGVVVFISALIGGVLFITGNDPVVLFNLPSVVVVVFGTLLCSWVFGGDDLSQRIVGLARYSTLTMTVGIIMSMVGLFADFGDPENIGPAMALGLLSVIYGLLLYVVAYCAQQLYVGKPFKFGNKVMYFQAVSSLSFFAFCIIGVLFYIV